MQETVNALCNNDLPEDQEALLSALNDDEDVRFKQQKKLKPCTIAAFTFIISMIIVVAIVICVKILTQENSISSTLGPFTFNG